MVSREKMRLPPTVKSTFFRGLHSSRLQRSAAQHASLIRSWHNDRTSRVAGSSSVLQPATTRILPCRPALFMKFTYDRSDELAKSRMKYNRAKIFDLFAHTVGFRGYPETFDFFRICGSFY